MLTTLPALVALSTGPASVEPTPRTVVEEAESSPPHEPFPNGRLEFVASIGVLVFDKAAALENGLSFGGELTHHFLFDNRLIDFAAYAGADGTLTHLRGTNEAIDVINASAGTYFSFRAHRRVMPGLRLGAGFVVVDGTKAGLPVRGRSSLHTGVGLRVFPVHWLVLRVEARMVVHDNVQNYAGSGQIQNVVQGQFSFSLGVIR